MNGVQYVDGFDYSGIQEPLTKSDCKIHSTLDDLLSNYSFNEELMQELKNELGEYVKNEVKNSTLEFVSRFFSRMGGSKVGYAVARALGFHVYIKDKDGNQIQSLNQIAEYFGCCPQLIDQLSKQIQEDLDIDPIKNLSIQTKNYSYKVDSPDGFMTTGEVLQFLGISNKKLSGIVKRLGIKKREYTRGSKLISEDDVDRIELYLMEGLEEISLGDVERPNMDTNED